MPAGRLWLFCLSLLFVACTTSREAPKNPASEPTGAESTDELCQNGVDDDNDGAVDCGDNSCLQSDAVTVCRSAESGDAACVDGRDNDQDGAIDCDDSDCDIPACGERSDTLCSDGVDNDENSFTDCEDFSCQWACSVSVCGSENTPEACRDGIDNDGNGFTDCDDRNCRDCVSDCGGGRGENTEQLCNDGVDNDSDGGADCQDSECVRLAEGCGEGAENTLAACSDGIDNDNDPYIDCDDFDCRDSGACVEQLSECDDGIDNDGDGFYDCLDFDCAELPSCSEGTDVWCADGLDNDGDNLVDCQDSDCRFGCNVTVCNDAGPVEKSAEACTDGLDNDADGFVDCDDSNCRQCVAACDNGNGGGGNGGGGNGGDPNQENSQASCSDGIDNDGNGLTDCQEPVCFFDIGFPECNTGAENTDELCSDGVDNDQDPYVDCDDFDCGGTAACDEVGNIACTDGADNDNDGLIDCADPQCVDAPSCVTASEENTDVLCSDGVDNDNDQNTDCDDVDCWNNPALNVCPTVVTTTIAALQDVTHPEHIALGDGERARVRLEGVTVTSRVIQDLSGRYRFFVQEAMPPSDVRYRGIEVFAGVEEPQVTPGALVNLQGFYVEHWGSSQITLGSVEDVGTGLAPVPERVAARDLLDLAVAEAYEGVLLQTAQVVVTDVDVQSSGSSTPSFLDYRVVDLAARNEAASSSVRSLVLKRCQRREHCTAV